MWRDRTWQKHGVSAWRPLVSLKWQKAPAAVIRDHRTVISVDKRRTRRRAFQKRRGICLAAPPLARALAFSFLRTGLRACRMVMFSYHRARNRTCGINTSAALRTRNLHRTCIMAAGWLSAPQMANTSASHGIVIGRLSHGGIFSASRMAHHTSFYSLCPAGWRQACAALSIIASSVGVGISEKMSIIALRK